MAITLVRQGLAAGIFPDALAAKLSNMIKKDFQSSRNIPVYLT